MFTVLTTQKPPEGFFQKLKYRVSPPKPKVTLCKVPGGTPFQIIAVTADPKRINWKRVRQFEPLYAHPVIPQFGIDLTGSGLTLYEEQSLAARLLFNSAAKVIQKSRVSPLKREVTLLDFDAEYTNLVDVFFPICADFRIVTNYPERYEDALERALLDYGMALYLTDEVGSAFQAKTVICPKKPEKPMSFSRSSVIFALSGEDIYASEIITAGDMELPIRYLPLQPKQVNPNLFACALHEYCGLSVLEQLEFADFWLKNRKISAEEAAQKLDEAYGLDYNTFICAYRT